MTKEQQEAAEKALAEQAEARKKQQEEAEKAREELEKVMNTYLDPEEGEKKIAEIDVQRAQIAAYRSSLRRQQLQIDFEFSNIDQQLAKLECDEAVIRRQILNDKEG